MPRIFIAIFFLAASSAVHAQITSTINLEVPASRSEKSSQKTTPAKSQKITTTGLGATPSEAEKQALSEAVRQAVGALLDAKTLIENEEVIEDRILTVNNGFVKSYDVVAPARKNSDGVFEIKISAVIETSIVAQALQDAGIKGEMAGQNLWAESTTKIMNVLDACKMLETKLPEFLQKMVVIEFSDAVGRVRDSSQPLEIIEEGDSVICIWCIKLTIDKAYYFKTALPVLQKCYEAISMSKPQEFSFSNPESEGDPSEIIYKNKKNGEVGLSTRSDEGSSMPFVIDSEYDTDTPKCILSIVNSVSRSGDFLTGLTYKSKNKLRIVNSQLDWSSENFEGGVGECYYEPDREPFEVALKIFSSQGELISVANAPFEYDFTGPFFHVAPVRGGDWLSILSKKIQFIKVKMPLSELKDAKKIEVGLENIRIRVYATRH